MQGDATCAEARWCIGPQATGQRGATRIYRHIVRFTRRRTGAGSASDVVVDPAAVGLGLESVGRVLVLVTAGALDAECA